jgi:phage gp16-like protein
MTIEKLIQADGSAEFDCMDCGDHIVEVIAYPTEPRCALCKWRREQNISAIEYGVIREVHRQGSAAMTAAARQLDPASERRRRELAFIHAAKKQLAMAEDAYRAMILRFSKDRTDSAGDLDQAERGKVMDHLRTFGAGRKPRLGRGGDDREQASKLRALWRSLYQLGAVRDPSDKALASFVQRQTGIAALRWNRPADLAAGIEALKSWCLRLGYRAHPCAVVGPMFHRFEPGLILAQWNRLRAIDALQGRDDGLGRWLMAMGYVEMIPERLPVDYAQDAVRRLGAWLRRVAKDDAA